ncbi:MAG: DUF465 domain-containing protein [Deltaproteobacteria bacterium]|nr:DUF465 domain-containing protein [Deltaproteobacteria bacterium]
MDDKELDLVRQLREENPRYRKLYEEHVLLEKELARLDGKRYLTPEEEFERKNIQKLKLAGKDEMETIRKGFRG